MDGRDYLIPDDVKARRQPVLRHRIVLKPEAELEGVTPDQVLARCAARGRGSEVRSAATLTPASTRSEWQSPYWPLWSRPLGDDSSVAGRRPGLAGPGVCEPAVRLCACWPGTCSGRCWPGRSIWLRLPKPRAAEVSARVARPRRAFGQLGDRTGSLTISRTHRAPPLWKHSLQSLRRLRDELPGRDRRCRPMARRRPVIAICPLQRGDAKLGDAYVRYQSAMRIAERWARAPLAQTVRVYPNLDEAKRQSMYLIRSRQIEMEKRQARMRGIGREFESLREYQQGDEYRDICWTRQLRAGASWSLGVYQVERSQTIWIVIDSDA